MNELKSYPLKRIEDAAVFHNEKVFSAIEYSEDQIVVALESATLLLLKNWELTHTYSDPNKQNDFWRRGFLATLPGFDSENFPFIACSGSKGINLVNVKQASDMIPLMVSETTCQNGQQAFFFKYEKLGLSIHFTSGRKLDNDCTRLNWIRMSFKPDFEDALREFGTLPITTTAEALKT